jgi:hypothetical protein
MLKYHDAAIFFNISVVILTFSFILSYPIAVLALEFGPLLCTVSGTTILFYSDVCNPSW